MKKTARQLLSPICIVVGFGLIVLGCWGFTNMLLRNHIRNIVRQELRNLSPTHHGGDPHLVWRTEQKGRDPITHKPVLEKVIWYMDLPLQNDHIQFIKSNPAYKTVVILDK